MSAGAAAQSPAGKREATKAANRAAILDAAREVFAEIGFGAASVRDIIRRTDLATGTFYNYFPDKESVLQAILEQTAGEARERVRAARRGARSAGEFIDRAFRAYFEYLVEDPQRLELLRRNSGTVRAMFDEPALGGSAVELRDDLRDAVAAGVLPAHDSDLMAAAMIGAGFEVGVRMLDAGRIDVDEAVALLTAIFAGGFAQLGR